MSLLITGAFGLLGQKLMKFFPNALHPSHDSLDIVDKNLVSKYIKENNVTQIIHTAAITSIRKCDEEILMMAILFTLVLLVFLVGKKKCMMNMPLLIL